MKKATVLVTKTTVDDKYRIVVNNNIWYDNLEKEQVFEAMEETTIELGNDGIAHKFEFEF